jgi:hypothetical protein
MLVSVKIDFQKIGIIKDKDRHYNIQNLTIISIYAPNYTSPKYMKQTLKVEVTVLQLSKNSRLNFLFLLEFDLRALHLLSSHSATYVTSPAVLLQLFF